MRVMMDLVRAIENDGLTLPKMLRYQQEYHEWRRWSVFEILKRHGKPKDIAPEDKAVLWHVARGELTTMPGGIGLAQTALRYAKEIEKENRTGAVVLHAAGAWISRYWLEEEAHHEVAYGTLLEEFCLDPIPEDEVIGHRGLFPTDNFLRNMMLQACVEVEVAVTYANQAKATKSPLIHDIFNQVMKDEVQHRQYFVSFAQALVDAKVYPAKDALAMAFTWLRPKGGELYGSKRDAQTPREGYVNWWETVRTHDHADAVTDQQHYANELFEKKKTSILKAVHEATGQRYDTVEDLQRGYFKSLAGVKQPRPSLGQALAQDRPAPPAPAGATS